MSKAFSKILANDLGLKTVAYVGVNDDWGRGSVKNFSSDLSGAGVKSVMVEYFDHGETDFSTLLAKLRAAKPDGIFIAAETQDGSVLVRQLKEFGVKSKVFGVGSWATNDFIKLTGDASNGIYAAVPYVSIIGGERNADFVKAYSAAYHNTPGKYSAAGFNSMNIVMDAVARAGSTDSDAVRKAMLETDYKAPNGEYHFTEKGEAYGFDAVLVQIQDGKLKIAAQTTIDKP
ncbi:Leucine-, isoleucine-, valine-, threonine-, and alanine-binding protein [Castellaniella defragrans]